jgi:uncharacterized membrane protein (DUF106 family)
MSLVNKKTLGTKKVKAVKDQMQDLRQKMLAAQKAGNTKQMNEYMTKMMAKNSEYMKFTMKPMLVSLLLVILVLPIIRGLYTGMTVAVVPETLPVVGGMELSWFWWYFIVSLTLSLVLRKVLGV